MIPSKLHFLPSLKKKKKKNMAPNLPCILKLAIILLLLVVLTSTENEII